MARTFTLNYSAVKSRNCCRVKISYGNLVKEFSCEGMNYSSGDLVADCVVKAVLSQIFSGSLSGTITITAT